MAEITADDLRAWRAAAEAATPGPWKPEQEMDGGGDPTGRWDVWGECEDDRGEARVAQYMTRDDAKLSALARTALPRLLDAWERLSDVVTRGLNAPSGTPLCSCRNVNVVRAGMERACWYCELRDALEPREDDPR